MRNANLGILASTLIMLLGCGLAGWEVNDGNAAPIVLSSFGSGLLVLSMLENRFPTKRDRGDADRR